MIWTWPSKSRMAYCIPNALKMFGNNELIYRYFRFFIAGTVGVKLFNVSLQTRSKLRLAHHLINQYFLGWFYVLIVRVETQRKQASSHLRTHSQISPINLLVRKASVISLKAIFQHCSQEITLAEFLTRHDLTLTNFFAFSLFHFFACHPMRDLLALSNNSFDKYHSQASTIKQLSNVC